MNTITPKWNGPTKIVEADELAHHTAIGWVLLDSFEVEESEIVHESAPRIVPDNNNGYDDGTVSTNRTIVLKKMQFLIGHDKKSALAEKEAEASEARNAKYAAEHAQKTAEEALKEAETSLAQQIAGRQGSAESSKRHMGERDTERKLRRKLEDDMGKVRKAIGDRQWDEITKVA
jgi:hypothetical protein